MVARKEKEPEQEHPDYILKNEISVQHLGGTLEDPCTPPPSLTPTRASDAGTPEPVLLHAEGKESAAAVISGCPALDAMSGCYTGFGSVAHKVRVRIRVYDLGKVGLDDQEWWQRNFREGPQGAACKETPASETPASEDYSERWGVVVGCRGANARRHHLMS